LAVCLSGAGASARTGIANTASMAASTSITLIGKTSC
jgi:hypothetical protein